MQTLCLLHMSPTELSSIPSDAYNLFAPSSVWFPDLQEEDLMETSNLDFLSE